MLSDGCTHRSAGNPPGARSRVRVKGGTLEVDIPRGPLFSTERAGTAGFALVLVHSGGLHVARNPASTDPGCLGRQLSILHERWCCGLSYAWATGLTGAARLAVSLYEHLLHSWQVWNGTTAVWTLSALAAGSVFGAMISLPFWFAGKPRLAASRKLTCMLRHRDTLPAAEGVWCSMQT